MCFDRDGNKWYDKVCTQKLFLLGPEGAVIGESKDGQFERAILENEFIKLD